MERAEGALGKISVLIKSTNQTALVRVRTKIEIADKLTIDNGGHLRIADKGEVVYAVATESYDPWPKGCIAILEEE